MPYTVEVPGHGVVEVPDGVSLQQAQIEIEKAFPYTGEDIAGAMQDPTFTPTKSDYLKFEEYSKTKQVDWINTAAQAADAAIGMIGGAISEGAQGAAANPLNYIEGFAQGTRQLYGLAAQSQDPSSPLFKFKDLVAGTGTPESRYNQFLDARQFGITSARLERGEEGIVVPPEYTNPEYVQGVSMILDPTLFVPGVGEILGTGKLATRAVGKGAQLTGRAIAGAAKPLERLAGAAERIAAETIGTTPEALRNVASTAGIAGALGIAPEAAAFAAIPAGIRTAREAGEALSRAGENLMTQPSRIGPLEAIGAAPGANLRQRMLGVIGQYGGDAAVDASLRGLAGGIEGAALGTGLGYLSGGEEGAAAGLGSGGVQGVAGALGGRAYQKLTGAAAKEARAGDLGRFIDSQQDPTTKALFERLRDTHGVDAASGLMDLQGLVRGKFGDIDILYRSNAEMAEKFGDNIRGVQFEQAERPTIFINADIIGKSTGDGPLYTLGHELFHALEKTTQLEGGATEIKDSLVGRWVQEGDVVRKLAEGAFNDAEIEARFNQYRDKLAAGSQERADQLAQYDTIDKKAGYVASELAAEHFAGLLAGQKPDALLKGFTGITRQLLDSALTQNASRALADAAATIERAFGVKPTDSVLFPDLKQASPQVNAMLRDLLRARRKLDERITIENEGPGKVLKPQDVSNPIAAKQLVDLGVAEKMPDGSVRSLSDEEIRVREEKDTTAIRTILEGVPGARVVDGEILGRFSPQQLSAIEQSQAVSSRMKDKIRAVNSAMDAGNSIFVNYGAATRRVKNRQTGKFTSKYNSGIRLSQREVLPYSFYLSKADNPVIKAIDISKIRGSLDKLTAPDGSVAKGLWGSVDGFMSDLAGYFTNLDAGEGARRSADIFGLEKAKYLGDFVNEQEKGGRKFVRDFRLDRIGSTTPMDFRARISEDAIQKSKMRWMPSEKLGDKSITNSEEGYRIISGAKHKLYGTDGKLIGIYDTQTQAERKADATQERLQPEVRQQQRQAGDEGRQATEAGGRNRIERGQEGQGQGGAVRQEGDVRFMPAEEEAARKQVAESLPRRASFEAQGVTRDESGNIFFKGKEPKDWTPTEFEEYGKAFGVPNLGPLSEIGNIPSDVAGNPARIPGGLEGKFTYYDLLWLKANPVDVANLPETTHAKLTAKLAATMAPTPGDKVSSFNSIVFGMLSPNAPLLPNEMGQARLRFGSMEDVRKFANLYPENPTKENLKELNQRLKKELGFISSGKGGLGIAITADISNIVNAARLFTKNPDFFVKKANESWADFVDKMTTQIKGFGTKTGSFGSVWQDPLKASISAMDRHMARIFGQELLGNPELRKRFEGIVVDRFNSMLKKSKEATSAFNRRLKNAEEKGKRIEEINKDDPKTLKTLKAKNDKRIKSIKAEMASTLDSLPDPTATRAKTIDDVLGQAQIYGADRVQKFVNEAVFAAMGSRKATLIAKKGGINPNAPEYIKSVDWVETPKDFQVMSDSYRSALEINERRANELGVAVFPAQWTLWDRIRGRVEPHEVMFPGLDKLPALNDQQLGEAQKANKAAGYGSTPEAGEKWKRKQIDSPSRLAYFMPAGEGEKLYEQRRPEQGGDRGGRLPRGSYTPLEGAPNVAGATGPAPGLVDVARSYAAAAGIPHRRQAVYVEVDEARAQRLADAYAEMKHAPQDPKVQEAYADLIRQTKDQYQALVDAGYEFSFFDSSSDPYKGNPSAAMRDLRANKRMAVYGTYDGYGTEGITGAEIQGNPMLEPTGLTWPDQRGVMHPVVANDLFRAVHDAFGHGLEGASFRARGEENAWQAHVRLFTGPAIAAITSETRGQNSWLNYGPHGERNRTAKLEDTVFSEQKTGLMPEWTWTEGRAADEAAPSQEGVAGQRYMPAADREVTRAVNINDNSQDFTGQILKGQKTIETRDTLNNAMQGVLGQRIGLTRTGTGDTKVVGYATVAKQPIVYRNESEFRRDQGKHLVEPDSKYDIKKGGVKYGYELTDVTPVEPFAPKSVSRMYSVIEPRYMPSDTDYLSAVKQGDTKTAQQMVDEAAKAAGYTVGPVFHGSAARFNQFKRNFLGTATGGQSSNEAFFFSTSDRTAKNYASYASEEGPIKDLMRKADQAEAKGDWDLYEKIIGQAEEMDFGPNAQAMRNQRREQSKIYNVYLNGRFLEMDAEGKTPAELSSAKAFKQFDGSLTAALKSAKRKGYDGVVFRNLDDAPNLSDPSDHYATFDPNKIKLSDPITKDDAGNVIPLSQRFKATSEDIRYMPAGIQREMGRNVDFANPPTAEKAVDALSSEKKSFWRKHDELPEGSSVGVRIDIPAFLNRGTYVQTIHESATPGDVGDRIGYDTSVRLSGPVKFFVKQGSSESSRGAVAIKEGRAKKHPIATVEGNLIKDRSVPPDIEDWTPVGMDPKKHSYFYDKRTGQPVKGGSESYSVGNTVFVKDPVPGDLKEFRYMPSPDSAMPGAYSFPGGYRALPGKAKGSLRLYGPAGSLIGIASSLDEAQRILRRKGNR